MQIIVYVTKPIKFTIMLGVGSFQNTFLGDSYTLIQL